MTQNDAMKENARKVGRPKLDVTLDNKQEVRCMSDEKRVWKNAADSLGLSVSEYVRKVVNKDASRVLKKQERNNNRD